MIHQPVERLDRRIEMTRQDQRRGCHSSKKPSTNSASAERFANKLVAMEKLASVKHSRRRLSVSSRRKASHIKQGMS
jgi:hypothetical protein